jgi:hypothetical protein
MSKPIITPPCRFAQNMNIMGINAFTRQDLIFEILRRSAKSKKVYTIGLMPAYGVIENAAIISKVKLAFLPDTNSMQVHRAAYSVAKISHPCGYL